MTRATKLPASGNSTDLLRGQLTKFGVWPLLFLYIHGSLNTDETHRRLARIGVEIGSDEVGQLANLAFAEARTVGA